MNRSLKLVAWAFGIVLLIGFYFSDNIRGYYRFKEICKKEAGLVVYEPIQRNEGWQIAPYSSSSFASYLLSSFDGISYVRYRSDNGIFSDLIRTGERKDRWDSGFRSMPASSNNQPRYEYRYEAKAVADEVRINRYTSTVTSLQSSKLAVIYQDFTYRLFNPEWGLGRGTACSSLNRDDLDKVPNNAREVALQKAFIQ